MKAFQHKSLKGKKYIILLIGPKGSGKTFIGHLIQENFGIEFLRVEDWVKKLGDKPDLLSEDYLRSVFDTIEAGVRKALKGHNRVVFESTGLTPYFHKMLNALKKDHKVITIRIKANRELCLKRIKQRDSSIHLNLAEEEIAVINKKVEKNKTVCDFEIENAGVSEKRLIKAIGRIIGQIQY